MATDVDATLEALAVAKAPRAHCHLELETKQPNPIDYSKWNNIEGLSDSEEEDDRFWGLDHEEDAVAEGTSEENEEGKTNEEEDCYFDEAAYEYEDPQSEAAETQEEEDADEEETEATCVENATAEGLANKEACLTLIQAAGTAVHDAIVQAEMVAEDKTQVRQSLVQLKESIAQQLQTFMSCTLAMQLEEFQSERKVRQIKSMFAVWEAELLCNLNALARDCSDMG